ncbi:MAG: hypothetical protein R2834_18825 [Rhodothermales bacterium]
METNFQEPIASPSYAEAEAAYKDVIDRMRRQAAGEYERLARSIDAELLAGLASVLAGAHAAHAALREPDLEDTSPPTTQEAWKRLVAYRQKTLRDVWLPIRKMLGGKPATTASAAVLAAGRRLSGWAGGIPVAIVLPAGADLHEPADGDSAGIRFKKRWLRWRDAGSDALRRGGNLFRRIAGRPPRERGRRERTIPARALTHYHTDIRLGGLLETAHARVREALSRRTATLEAAFHAWTNRLFELGDRWNAPFDALPALDAWASTPAAEAAPPVDPALWAEWLDIQNDLAAALASCCEPMEPFFQPTDAALADAADAFARDLEAGGTVALDLNDRLLPPASQLPLARMEVRSLHDEAWHEQATNRYDILIQLHRTRDFFLEKQQTFLDRIARSTLLSTHQAFKSLSESIQGRRERIRAISETALDQMDPSVMGNELKLLQRRLAGEFKAFLGDMPGLIQATQMLTDPGVNMWEDMLRHGRNLPEALTIHEPGIETSARSARTFIVDLREIAGAIWIDPLPRRLRDSARLLQKALINTWEQIQQVQGIVDFSLNEALKELGAETPPDAGDEDARTEADAIVDAREMVLTGLQRSGEKLSQLINALRPPWEQLVHAAHRALQRDWQDFHQHVLAGDFAHGPIDRLRIRLNHQRKELLRRSGLGIAKLADMTRGVLRLGRRQTRELIRKGQSAVGAITQTEGQWIKTLGELADAESLHDKLPLIYRKLFALAPLDDAALLEGRKQDVIRIRAHVSEWAAGQTSPLILAIPDGSGRTSFMNILATSVFTDADVRRITLTHRVTTTTAFARMAAEALEQPVTDDLTLESLEAALTTGEAPIASRIVLIDFFEHLLLAMPGGTEVLERVMLFMSRTDHVVCWIASVAGITWRFIETTLRPASGFVKAHGLPSLNQTSLEALILNRHRRSGLPLEFVPPASGSPVRSLWGRKSHEQQQEAWRKAYFEQLYRFSGTNILLALNYWLRSAAYDAGRDVLCVNPLQPIDFSFLNTLDLQRMFTLRLFLLHGTLTVEEHRRISRTSPSESMFILESLLNLGIIQSMRPDLEEFSGSHIRIMPDEPYRINPVILHPVTETLKLQRILY